MGRGQVRELVLHHPAASMSDSQHQSQEMSSVLNHLEDLLFIAEKLWIGFPSYYNKQ